MPLTLIIRVLIASIMIAGLSYPSIARTGQAVNQNRLNINQKDIIYSIMVDRFEDGDKSNDFKIKPKSMTSYHGGDLQGVINKLDYLKDLGVTALWLSPVFEDDSSGYHGYYVTDYYRINRHFGDIEKFKELVNLAHAKNIKIILDLVINHTGTQHPWISDSSMQNWYHPNRIINDNSSQADVEIGRLSGLPDLAQENPAVKKYLIDLSLWWIAETKIDGYRLDAARYVPKWFWKDFAAAIKSRYPGFYIVGETWSQNPSYVNEYQDSGIDGMMDFPLLNHVLDYFNNTKKAEDLAVSIAENNETYSNRDLYCTFVDNHDLKRYISLDPSYTEENLKQALTFLLTYTGIPIIYYGTELAMEGGTDPDNRRNMEWNKTSSVTEYVKKLIVLRKKFPAFTGGSLNILKASGNFFAYSRVYGNDFFAVVFNSDRKEAVENTITIPAEFIKKGPDLVNVFDSYDSYHIDSAGNASIKLKPNSAKILALGVGKSLFWIGTVIVIFIFAGLFLAGLKFNRSKKKVQLHN